MVLGGFRSFHVLVTTFYSLVTSSELAYIGACIKA